MVRGDIFEHFRPTHYQKPRVVAACHSLSSSFLSPAWMRAWSITTRGCVDTSEGKGGSRAPRSSTPCAVAKVRHRIPITGRDLRRRCAESRARSVLTDIADGICYDSTRQRCVHVPRQERRLCLCTPQAHMSSLYAGSELDRCIRRE